mmetsp:Transcript_87970/g.139765  ORF Transcript_87970/g.139765 Transcript_87970/m.139765 type:complete len:256 (+) Transcript_87970:1146-1913(+)
MRLPVQNGKQIVGILHLRLTWCLDSSNRKGKGLAIQRIQRVQGLLLQQQRAAAPLEAPFQGQQPLPNLLDATSGRISPGAKQRQGTCLLEAKLFQGSSAVGCIQRTPQNGDVPTPSHLGTSPLHIRLLDMEAAIGIQKATPSLHQISSHAAASQKAHEGQEGLHGVPLRSRPRRRIHHSAPVPCGSHLHSSVVLRSCLLEPWKVSLSHIPGLSAIKGGENGIFEATKPSMSWSVFEELFPDERAFSRWDGTPLLP